MAEQKDKSTEQFWTEFGRKEKKCFKCESSDDVQTCELCHNLQCKKCLEEDPRRVVIRSPKTITSIKSFLRCPTCNYEMIE